MREVGQQGVAPRVLVDGVADVAVEVAIGAFGDAERPVDVERERCRLNHIPFVPSEVEGRWREVRCLDGARHERFHYCPKRLQQFERVGAVADGVLCGRIDLAEGLVHADGDEHRVVAEAVVPARRPHQGAVDLAFEAFARSPSGQASDKAQTKWASWPASGPAASTSRHTRSIARPKSRVAVFILGPASRVDAGQAVERIDRETAVVGQRGQARQVGRWRAPSARHCRRR